MPFYPYLITTLFSLISLSTFTIYRCDLLPASHRNHHPDFSNNVREHNFTDHDLKPYKRIIFVGDVHGMEDALDDLLDKVSYKRSHDLLVHVGDFTTKGPKSINMLSRFAKANTTGVRGNHEQQIIEWRAWITWVESEGGKAWLARLEREHPDGIGHRKGKTLRWPIPKKWDFMEEHYRIARNMTSEEYEYLRRLPSVLHFHSLHTFAVHGGMLPFDPNHPLESPKQPLARKPRISSESIAVVRTSQEHSILTDVSQNKDMDTLLNIRSVTKTGEVSRNNGKGTPWSNLWTKAISRCHGYSHFTEEYSAQEPLSHELPCHPINVVYGHAALRGLDIKEWSFGLDSDCVSVAHYF
ncbi:hypothetical protein M422DRAFT_224551 [Sphaerobolus stellatus SS14]|nr:hypothetical protein M422DRAFT_224551 [Sphaerobolus stellatus SS14]